MTIIDSVEEYESILESMPKMALPYSSAEVRETFELLFEIVGAAQDLSDDIHQAFPEGLSDGLGVLDVDGGYAILMRRLDDALKIAPDWIKEKGSSNG